MKTANVLLTITTVLFALAMVLPQAGFAQGSGKALDFDGTDDYVDCGNDASLDPTSAITMEAWINWTVGEGDASNMIMYNGSSNRLFYIKGTGQNITFRLRIDNKPQVLVAAAKVGTGWHHIAVTYDHLIMKIYMDGVLDANTNSVSGTMESGTDPTTIGGDGTASNFEGTIDEVRIWNVGRTQTEIRDNMCKKLSGSETGLVGYWRCDDGADPTDDYSDNSNTGTLGGGTAGYKPTFQTSGAAIGDDSGYQYSTTPSVTITNGNESFKADNFLSDPTFAHVYRIEAAPNYTTANSPLDHVSQNRYWGVFVGSSSPTYDVTNIYTDHGGIDNESVLELGTRTDPTVTSWSDAGADLTEGSDELKVTGISGNDEYILASMTTDNSLPVELTSFTARQERGAVVVLEWVTESEIENLGFILERRSEGAEEQGSGGEWQEIASYITHPELQGQGSVTYRTEYSYTDNTVEIGKTYDYRLADVSYEGVKEYHSMTVLGVIVTEVIPYNFVLYPAYPNPFNPATTIQFDLPEAVQVKLMIYDIRGREVKTLIDGIHEAGSYSVKWSGRNDNGVKLSSGVYFVVMKANAMKTSQKIVLLR